MRGAETERDRVKENLEQLRVALQGDGAASGFDSGRGWLSRLVKATP